MKQFLLIFDVIKQLLSAVTHFIDAILTEIEAKKKRTEDEKELRREDAIEDFKEAKDEKEAMDAQKRIVQNRP